MGHPHLSNTATLLLRICSLAFNPAPQFAKRKNEMVLYHSLGERVWSDVLLLHEVSRLEKRRPWMPT
jgi:hypothetical protein